MNIKDFSHYATNKQLIIAFLTIEYLEIALNWIEGIEQLGISNYVICCFDEASYQALKSKQKNAVKGPHLDILMSSTINSSCRQKWIRALSGFFKHKNNELTNEQNKYQEVNYSLLSEKSHITTSLK